MSHDLRTPLTTIKGIAHEIAHGGDPERALAIEEEADRLAALVEGLLEVSRIDADASRVRMELNTLDDLVGAAIQRAESTLHPHPIEVDLGATPLLAGRFDFAQSLRILVNLLDNAAKYSPAGSPIELTVRRRGEKLLVSVADRGAGIAPGDQERIFDPFFRASGSPPDVRGTGLGLAIARRLARAQGGELTATPREGGGTIFTVELIAGELPTE